MTEALCVTCPVLRPKGQPRRPNTPQVCDTCRARLAADLTALPESYALIDSEPVRAALDVQISGRAFESRPPLNINALSLLGRGSLIPATDGTPWPQDQLGTVPPLDLLAWWALDWAGVLGQEPPPAVVYSVCIWLYARLNWACDAHPAIDEFAQDVRELTGQLRPFVGRDRGERVGNCPRAYGSDRCNTPLYVDPYVDQIECSRCHTKWKRRDGEWMHLRAQQISAGVEAA